MEPEPRLRGQHQIIMNKLSLKIKHIAGIFVWVSVMCFSVSCRSDRPQPFLNQKQMCELLCDIRLAEAHLYQTREKQDEANRVMIDRSIDVYVPVFQKYSINYTQYQAIERYYMRHPEKMEKIMRAVAEKLKAMKSGRAESPVEETAVSEE